MEELKSPPRTPPEINAEYAKLCMQLGEMEFRQEMMVTEDIPKVKARLIQLAGEMNISQAYYAKAEQQKNEQPQS
jgi:hypothetical protein